MDTNMAKGIMGSISQITAHVALEVEQAATLFMAPAQRTG